ncbi:MAG: phosphatidylinositol kinase [Sphingobacteriales bacterium]|nr:MAG: phosphatidylinositol kinase [Sphingobacteriales bacterium]
MHRSGTVYYKNMQAGRIWQDDNGYHFQYDPAYLHMPFSQPVSLTLPLTANAYCSKILFPFFDGLIPEGWLLDITVKNWKTDPNDRMGLLLTACRDCIGAVSVHPQTEA